MGGIPRTGLDGDAIRCRAEASGSTWARLRWRATSPTGTGFPADAWLCLTPPPPDPDAVVTTDAGGVGPYDPVQAAFTPALIGDVSANLVSAGGLACTEPIVNPSGIPNPPLGDLIGKIVLILSGICAFTEKVANAEAAGCDRVIVHNAIPGAPLLTMGGTANPTIPAVFITNEAGRGARNRRWGRIRPSWPRRRP